ncbi:hypothetical protein [Asanoa siamensis]|uniref:Integral membrane protein n=1 Tax=Asanoa siamensis TaxID=926357 RepID=A0ABQ4CL38_9ACTN|nr:hypothetical protein [Asanoa siamensis]GIF71990.1 hypothetical protein Asi02nite_15080 [Asanoa siamensis]
MGDRLVRWGLPRAANAVPLLMEFIVVAVATVLSIRFALFITGYPRLGGGGLHVAHVLWGGLLMAVGVMGLLSFNGRVIRPIGSFLAGVGFGLFIDEVGKFLTSDNDYFFTPSIAIMYVVIVLLVLGIHALHGRRPMSPRELYAAALTTAAAGVTNGMTDYSRQMALRRLHAAGGLPGTEAAAALVHEIPRGRAEKYDVSQIGTRVARRIAKSLRTRWAMVTTIVILVVQTVVTLGFALLILSALLAFEAGADVTLRFTEPVPTAVGGASSLVSAACVVWGLVRLRQKRRVTGYRWLQRAVLIDLLLTRVFEFAVYQFAAIPALLIDLLLLAALEYAIRSAVRDEAAADDGSAEAAEAGRPSPTRVAASAGVAAGLGAATVAAGRASGSRAGRLSWGGGAAAPAAASLSAGSAGAVPSGAADIGPGAYPGALPVVASADRETVMPSAAPSPLDGAPANVAAPAERPLPAAPPALGGPAAPPSVLPGASPVGGPGPYFASLPASAASASAGAGAAVAGLTKRPPPERDCEPSFGGGCHSQGGMIGGATAAGCGAFAGGLVAGMSTWSAGDAAVPADTGSDAGELVGEVLDDSRPGDHGAVPQAGAVPSEPSTRDGDGDRDLDEPGRSPRSVGGQPPAATWVGSREKNAGATRYRPSSNVDPNRKVTPPPLS